MSYHPLTTPLGPMRGRLSGMEPHSNYTGNQQLVAHEYPFRRHEIGLTTGPNQVLENFFTPEEIRLAVNLRHPEVETVPFYLVRMHREIDMRFGKRKLMKSTFKDESDWPKYKVLVEYGLFHDEIMESLANSRGDFEVAIYALLDVKKSRAGQINTLRQKFTGAQLVDAIEDCDQWCNVVYYMMTEFQAHRVTLYQAGPIDGDVQKYIEMFHADGTSRFFNTLHAFGFTPQAIVASWQACPDWKLIPYNLLKKYL